MLTFLILFIFAISTVRCFKIYAIKKNILDKPSARSSHTIPTPRGGGVVFPILWTSYLLLNYFLGVINAEYPLIFVPPIIFLGLVGYLDDRRSISAKWRFLTQFIIAAHTMCMLGGFPSIQIGVWSLPWGYIGVIFAVLALVWSANLYNFMDGIDGIAAIEALFVFGCGGYFIWHAGGIELAKLIWAMAVIVAGFLVWNRPPAKIFMGDVGSTLLGFLVMLFGIIGEIWYQVPLLLWFILYGVFWFDATVTLMRRAIHGDVWYQPHRLHAYQRLQLNKWTHKKILLLVIGINILLMVVALFADYYPLYATILFLLALLILVVYYLIVEKLQPMYGAR